MLKNVVLLKLTPPPPKKKCSVIQMSTHAQYILNSKKGEVLELFMSDTQY